jgi:NADP-dependent 3-hydroxy acid dehydrogenase YdfG
VAASVCDRKEGEVMTGSIGSLEEKVVLVTGASLGIGKATARLLAEKGFQVFATSRRLYREHGNGFQMLQLDVTSDGSVADCVSGLIEKTRCIDVLAKS